MFRSSCISRARTQRSGGLSLGLLGLTLLFASSAYAQQLSIPGLQSPVEKSSAKQDLPVEVRAAQGQAPLNRLYPNLKVDQSKVRHLSRLDPSEIPSTQAKKLRIGAVRELSRPVNLDSDSARYAFVEGNVRVMGIVSEGALYTRIHFSKMSLPAGARVFVYSMKNPDEFYGPYESHGPSNDGTFWTPPIEGQGAVIEYFTPNGIADPTNAPFHVSQISHIFTDPLFKATPEDPAAGACNLEVASQWANVATSVGFLQFTEDGGEYACTGTLLNNESNDFTPYLLTANHCFDSQAVAQTLRVYWNYNTGESPAPGTPRTDGANLLSTSNSSDFTLVRLTGVVPGGLYFAGWDASPTPLSTAVTGIHHPQASHKRISFGSTVSGCAVGPPSCDYYTDVRWNQGTTEPGSSGSALWKGPASDPRLVGTLTGGAASCSNQSGVDYYGSFSQTYGFISSFLQRGDNGADDNLEQNDTRSTALSLESGAYNNLVVKGSDEDWYKVSAVAGVIFGAKITFTNSSGNINLQLYRGGDPSPVGTSDGTSDLERVTQINQSGTTEDYYLRVYAPPGVQNTYTLTIGGTGAACSPVPVNYGQSLQGSLAVSDCKSWWSTVPSSTGIRFADRYSFTAQQGQQIVATMSPGMTFNTFVSVQGIVGQSVYSEPLDVGKPGSNISFIAPATGTYTIEASSFDSNVTGNYQLALGGQPETISIAQPEYTVKEDDGRVAIVVNRGPNAQVEATVGYATSDSAGLNECTRVDGFASSRCDYATSFGTLRFAPGETSKTIYIPLVDDAYAEGRERLGLTLYDIRGAVYGSYQSTIIYIDDNDAVAGVNPTNQVPFFVRQHYIDFLGREPDPAGYAGWQDILNNCGTTVAPPCDRIEVSSAFFRSDEFQSRGYFIYRFYSAVGKIPLYPEFMPDLAKVSGFLSSEQLEANKVAFVQEFMTRGNYLSKYGSLNNPTTYVDALLQTVGLPNHASRATWIAGLTNGALSKAQVLRALVESTEVYQKYYNEAFVIMQYFGYLRRTADASYTQWIQTMNQNGGDYRLMINGFMNSSEYRQRFGP